jgi:class 3 adenylate cyclase
MAQFVSPHLPAPAQLKALIEQRHQQPHRVDEIDAEIRDRFLVTRALLVLDMADFSRLTQTQGIIPTLQTIFRLRETAIPTLAEQDGTVLKAEADNLYAIFAHPDAALTAAHRLLQRLNEIDLHASMGIGYGDVLMVGDREIYGNEMNLASKLGEDLAQDDDILLTENAYKALLDKRGWRFAAFQQEISDVALQVYRLQRSAD